MKGLSFRSFIPFLLFVFALSGCNFPTSQQTPTPAPTTAVPAVTMAAPTATDPSTATPAPVSHTSMPGDPAYVTDQVAVDCNTGLRYAAGASDLVSSGCDYWNREWLERPADSMTGGYQGALDIVWAQAGASGPWTYLRIKTYNLGAMPDGYQAGFELDQNLDSRGDFLLLASKPSGTTWTTDGVQVWQDTNGDVGGSKPFAYDAQGGNGYETNLVDSGQGNDPDLAWVRISPTDSDTIEFAFKSNLLHNPNVFGWWAWTGTANVSPAKFELVDSEQNDSTWDVDNTCSWIFGAKPKANQLLNLCAVVQPTATPTNTPPPSRPRPTATRPIIIY